MDNAQHTSHRDKVVDEVVEKVQNRSALDPEVDVRARAEQAVDELLDAPLQTFTPLLAENEVVSSMHVKDRAEGP